jgi:signal transduction histidine kinase
MRPDPQPARSAAWRGALWITLIALVTTSVALTLQYVQTTQTIDARRAAVVDDEASGLVERYRSDGVPGVAQAIQRQVSVPRIHEFFYLLTLSDGTPIVGNLLGWPAAIQQGGFYRFETAVTNTRGISSRRWVEARAIVLDDGERLLVGDFADERGVLRERYLSGLLWSLVATGALGLLFGWWYARRGLAFVKLVSDVGQRFLGGSMGERVPVSQRGDEYDRLAETINRTFGEVERLVDSLRAATDGMAHDLKTPLTRIRARLELAEMESGKDVTLRNAVAETRSDLDAMLQLIEDMLSLARAEAAGSASFAPVALNAIVAEALELYAPVAEEKGLNVTAALAPTTVSGSRLLLGRLVANLLDNAVKFTPTGGRIEVRLDSDADGVRFQIADSGSGIPAERVQEALGRFRRLDESRSTVGSGLGLSIVAAVARVHRANLRFGDNLPGLRVELRFPLEGVDIATRNRAEKPLIRKPPSHTA